MASACETSSRVSDRVHSNFFFFNTHCLSIILCSLIENLHYLTMHIEIETWIIGSYMLEVSQNVYSNHFVHHQVICKLVDNLCASSPILCIIRLVAK